MVGKYYKLMADPNAVNRWHLDEPLNWRGEDVDSRIFTDAVWYEGEKVLTVPLQYEGERVDFNFAAFDVDSGEEGPIFSGNGRPTARFFGVKQTAL